MYCCIIWHFCSIIDTKKIEKMQLKVLRHIYKDYTSSYGILREECNRHMLLIERQRAMLLEVYKCIHELGPHMFLCMKVLSYGIQLVMVSKQQRIFQNLKRYLKSGIDLLAYVKIVSFAP